MARRSPVRPASPPATASETLSGLAAHHDEAAFVGDGPVEGQPEQVVRVLAGADLGHRQFHLERLLLGGKDRAQALRVDAGQAPGR